MPGRDEVKAALRAALERRADELVRIAEHVLANPEPGFREVKTSRFVAERFREMGIPYRDGIALTGLKGALECGGPGPTVAVIGELDSLIVRGHPHADPETGAAHACGHHAQLAMMLGVAMALKDSPQVVRSMRGRVAFLAVPAEEYIEIEYRMGLREEGKVEFLGGKPEFIRLGEFDNIDLAMMTHTTSDPHDKLLALPGTNNGTVAKQARFIGRGAHAGGSPHLGINALNAAMLALSAIHANRETFQDQDTVRVHPIITKGGEAVSAVPADVRLETFVRGKTIQAIQDADRKVDRSLRAGALAVGGRVQITTLPGYLPLRVDRTLAAIYRANAEAVVGQENVAQIEHRTGSTDMGDVSHIMPAVHPYAGGATGVGHGADYVIKDYRAAVLNPATAMAMTLVDLLADGASGAQRVLSAHKPAMTRAEYLKLMRSFAREEEYSGEGQ
ncbi:MAG: amidohydrolase [Chloroflexi bacterium]|nr:amidohydrolase [Chloroflexota bacterium]